MKNKKKFFRSRLFLAIVGTTIGTILAEIFTNLKILTAIFKFFIFIKNTIVKFFSASISTPLWLFLLLLIIAVVFIVLILMTLLDRKKSSPSFLNYIEDVFFKVVWTWRWKYNRFSEKYSIEDLTPFCPKCECQLIGTVGGGGLQCPNCDFRIDRFPKSLVELELIIRQRARKNL